MTDAIDTPEDVSLADLPSPSGPHDLFAKFKPLIQEREAGKTP